MPQAAKSPSAELRSYTDRRWNQTRSIFPGGCWEVLLLNAETNIRRVYLSFLSFLAATSQAGALPVQSVFANCFISRAESVLVSCIFLFKWANAVHQPSNLQSLFLVTRQCLFSILRLWSENAAAGSGSKIAQKWCYVIWWLCLDLGSIFTSVVPPLQPWWPESCLLHNVSSWPSRNINKVFVTCCLAQSEKHKHLDKQISVGVFQAFLQSCTCAHNPETQNISLWWAWSVLSKRQHTRDKLVFLRRNRAVLHS